MAATQGYMLPGLRGESVSRSAMFLLVFWRGVLYQCKDPQGI